MKIHIENRVSLSSINRLLVQCMEIANKIEDKDFLTISLHAQKRKGHLKNIKDNVDRGNVFMMLFFIRELLETLINDDSP